MRATACVWLKTNLQISLSKNFLDIPILSNVKGQ